jgi:hypothetical protein
VVALLREDAVPGFAETVLTSYRELYPELPSAAYVTRAAAGAGPLAV